jgi:hypothetical protein
VAQGDSASLPEWVPLPLRSRSRISGHRVNNSVTGSVPGSIQRSGRQVHGAERCPKQPRTRPTVVRSSPTAIRRGVWVSRRAERRKPRRLRPRVLEIGSGGRQSSFVARWSESGHRSAGCEIASGGQATHQRRSPFDPASSASPSRSGGMQSRCGPASSGLARRSSGPTIRSNDRFGDCGIRRQGSANAIAGFGIAFGGGDVVRRQDSATAIAMSASSRAPKSGLCIAQSTTAWQIRPLATSSGPTGSFGRVSIPCG